MNNSERLYSVTMVEEAIVTYSVYATSVDQAIVKLDESEAVDTATEFGDKRIISIQEVLGSD